MAVCALIVAAGRGSRAREGRHDLAPKQYAKIGDKAVLAYSLFAFLTHPGVDHVQVVIHPDDRDLYDDAVGAIVGGYSERLAQPVSGGADRQASVRAGLEALSTVSPEAVLIHDGARPFVPAEAIDAVLAKLKSVEGAICAIPVSDTLKKTGDGELIVATVSRDLLWRAQTPQGFKYSAILAAHRKAAASTNVTFTDDASIAEWAGLNVAVVSGAASNVKLTTLEDLVLADRRLKAQQDVSQNMGFETHVGTGFDVHRFGDGDHVWLCGVQIAHNKTLLGHSDADVGLHVLTDAVLGAIGDGDIGTHFPPSDPQWEGARSEIFLKDAIARLRARGGELINVDVTLICEEPKVGPHRPKMRAAMAGIMDVDIGRVSVKATTTEQLGFTGRGEGIGAMASVSVRLPV